MIWLIAGVVALALALGFSSWLTRANSARLARGLRLAAGGLGVATGGFLVLTGKFGFGILLGGAGVYLLTGKNILARASAPRETPPSTGASRFSMARAEAYEILGLEPGASESEITARYWELMKRVHPDRGGSSALAAQLNEARDVLLGNRK